MTSGTTSPPDAPAPPSAGPAAARPWWLRQRFLLARRASQFGLLGLFLLGPVAGIWWARGN
ncbi:MAG: hypothetical protein RLW62_21590, partial [Gammaproteobacteria bacterium]